MLGLAADFLGSSIANRVTDKLTQVYEKIWCCRSGSAADTQAINDIVQHYLSVYAYVSSKNKLMDSLMYDRPPTVQVAAAIFQELCYSNKEQLSAGLIIAGWDELNGPEVYHIPAGGSLHKQEFSIGGSGSTYIYGYCDANFREDMTKEEGIEFVKNCNHPSVCLRLIVALALAMSRDGSSGGVIRMMILTGENPPERLMFTEPNIPKFWEKE